MMGVLSVLVPCWEVIAVNTSIILVDRIKSALSQAGMELN